MTHLPGKVVAITGAGSGIGRALAVALAERGCALALCDIDPDGLAGTTTRCQDGPHVTADVVDVSEWVAVRQWARKVLADHGHVDVVVNNAGLGCVATVADTSVEDFQQVLGVDLWGVIHGVKAFLPHLLERPEAHLVNVASVAALSPWPSNGAYTIAKYGVDALSQTLMAELAGTTVKVSCVYPGGVRTNIARTSLHITDQGVSSFGKRARMTPERAAETVLDGIERDRERILVGADAHVVYVLHRLMPVTMRRLIAWGWRRRWADAA